MPVHLPATGSVWAISDTADKTVTMARGLLEAATSDDISPVALLACGSFGSLLPVSPETRVKVDQLARRNHTSQVLNFVKAQIGYKKDDSVEQLSRSDPGLRFLCLVATLCTLDHYDAADRLDAMLQATQQGFQIRPTIRQLQVMLKSMKTKMILSDFATSVAGFEIMLRASLEGQGASYQFRIAQIPTKESLQDLVIAMNQLGRLAEQDSIETVDVRLNSCYTPWTCAFIKWLLGVPPLIRTVQGKTLLHQDQSSITLTILSQSPGTNPNKRTADGKSKLEVVPVHKVRGLRDLIFLEPTNGPRYAWQGLVGARSWVDYQFSILFDRLPQLRKEGKLRNALGQALYFIVAAVPERLLLCDDFGAFKTGMSHCDGNVEDMFHPTAPKAFLSSEVRVQITNELVKGHITLVQEDNDKSGTLLPQNLAKALKAGCRQCQNPTNDIFAGQLPCKVHELLEWIGDLGSTLLTLSLFGPCVEAFPMLKAGQTMNTTPFHHRLYPLSRKQQAISSTSFSKLIMTGWQALMHGQCAYLSCPPMTIFQHAAKMMGHQKIWDSTIISSLYGQALFPAFFEARDFPREGFLQMSAVPGKLQKGDMQFDFLLDSWSNTVNTEGVSDAETEEVDSDLAEGEEEGHDYVDRGEDISTGNDDDDDEDNDDDDEQMEDIRPQDAEEDYYEEQRASNNESSQDHLDSGRINAGSAARRPVVPASFRGTRRQRLIASAEVMKWSISVRDEMLHGELRLQNDEDMVIAWSLIESLARARLSPACPHQYNNPAGDLAGSFEMAPDAGLQGHGWSRTLIVAGQSYPRQLWALQAQDGYPPVVVHVDGCIQCAMRLGLADRVTTILKTLFDADPDFGGVQIRLYQFAAMGVILWGVRPEGALMSLGL